MVNRIHQRVTDIIFAQLASADPGAWACPWHRSGGGLPTNALTGRSYRGINVLTLWCAARREDYPDHRWATLKQWNELGARVLKGESGSPCIFYSRVEEKPKDAIDTSTASSSPSQRRTTSHYDLMRMSLLFNAAQVEGAPRTDDPTPTPLPPPDPTPAFDRFVAQTGATIRPGSNACYVPALDIIRMPAREAFASADTYAATLAHELIHWTGAPDRLNRAVRNKRGTTAYAAEELVAELGSAFVLAGLALAAEPHPSHAAYMASWLPLVRADPAALFTAAAQAARAADWLTTNTAASPP